MAKWHFSNKVQKWELKGASVREDLEALANCGDEAVANYLQEVVTILETEPSSPERSSNLHLMVETLGRLDQSNIGRLENFSVSWPTPIFNELFSENSSIGAYGKVQLLDLVCDYSVEKCVEILQNNWPIDKDEEKTLEYMAKHQTCLLYTSPSPRDATLSRMPSSA